MAAAARVRWARVKAGICDGSGSDLPEVADRTAGVHRGTGLDGGVSGPMRQIQGILRLKDIAGDRADGADTTEMQKLLEKEKTSRLVLG
jgi:hypothetical protein